MDGQGCAGPKSIAPLARLVPALNSSASPRCPSVWRPRASLHQLDALATTPGARGSAARRRQGRSTAQDRTAQDLAEQDHGLGLAAWLVSVRQFGAASIADLEFENARRAPPDLPPWRRRATTRRARTGVNGKCDRAQTGPGR
jgi:hypothetical protein